MKIILSAKSVYPFHPVGGVQKYVYNFGKFLSREGVDVEIIAPLDKGAPREEIYDGIKYRLIRPAIFWYLEYPIGWLGVHLFSRSLARYLNNYDFDILHSFDMTGYQYLKNNGSKPVIAHIFTDNYLSNPIATRNPLNIFHLMGAKQDNIKQRKVKISPYSDKEVKGKYRLQYEFKVKPMHMCADRAQAIFSEDQSIGDEIDELYKLKKGKNFEIPVGTDLDEIDDIQRSNQFSREAFNIKKNDLVLMTVNRLAADKGVDKIVLSLKEISKKIPDVKLIIIGSGYQEKEIYRLIKENNLEEHVRHFKNVSEDDLYGYYGLADIYICAFSFPGSSISTLEAMASSLPIITTAQPWLVHNQKNGVLLNDNDPQSIENAVVNIANNKSLKKMGTISRKIVEDYDWKVIVKKAINVYHSILKKEVLCP